MSIKKGVNALTKTARIVAVLISLIAVGFALFDGQGAAWVLAAIVIVIVCFVGFVGGWILDSFVE
jgi:hypothetical protein